MFAIDLIKHIIIQLSETSTNSDQLIEGLEQNFFMVPPDQKGDVFLDSGLFLYERSRPDFAADLLQHALKHYINNNNRYGELRCYRNLGHMYYDQGDYGKALVYHRKTLPITIELGLKAEQSNCYGNLGSVHFHLKDFRKAIKYYEKSVQIAVELEDRDVELQGYKNLCMAYENLKDFQKAAEYRKKSIQS